MELVLVLSQASHSRLRPLREGEIPSDEGLCIGVASVGSGAEVASPDERVRPARGPHTGQAFGPCAASTRRATSICSSRVARSAREAYFVPW